MLWFSVKDAVGLLAPRLLGLYWCAVGVVIATSASSIAKRVGAALAAEVGLTAGPDPVVAQLR